MWTVLCSLVTALGLGVFANKLDPAYLPPAGAATSGGFPGDISAPLLPTFVPIISYENNPNTGDGSYSFAYETGNGIKASEEGAVKALDPEGQAQVVQGVFSYTGPDGKLYTLAYTADEHGFVARGDHLPTAPPVPPEIQAALEQNAAEEAVVPLGTGPTTPAPAQVGYFKSYPAVYHNRHHFYNQNQNYNKYFQRY